MHLDGAALRRENECVLQQLVQRLRDALRVHEGR
jgi:hypothetical protein